MKIYEDNLAWVKINTKKQNYIKEYSSKFHITNKIIIALSLQKQNGREGSLIEIMCSKYLFNIIKIMIHMLNKLPSFNVCYASYL